MERKVVTVSEVQPVKEGTGQRGAWKMLPFKADGLTYQTYDTNLFPFIVAGANLDIEFEVKVNGEFTNRRVVNIYGKDGQPVIAPKGGFGGGFRGGGFKDSASIERQVSAKLAVEIATEDMTLDQILSNAEKIYRWIHQS
jgi:hypothetical protein